MKKVKEFLSKPIVTILLFVMALGLLIASGTGATQAALTYYSDTYQSRLQLTKIGVSLLENGEIVSYRDYDQNDVWSEATGTLLDKRFDEKNPIQVGVTYPEVITVQNTGDINEFVRVTIRAYWTDADGNKDMSVDPDLINLNYVNQEVWLEDTSDQTDERKVFYYKDLLDVDRTTLPLIDSFSIDKTLNQHKKVITEEKDGKKVIKTVYTYDELNFCIEAKVDAVQEHNAEQAIHSSWGKNVQVDGTTLRLN